MQPFLLAFVDTQFFTISMILLLVGTMVIACVVAAGLFATTRQGLRQWRASGAGTAATIPRLKAAVPLLPVASLLLAGTWYMGRALYHNYQSGQRWDLLQQQKATLSQQLPGRYVLADSFLCDPPPTRLVQWRVSGWGSPLPDTVVAMPRQRGQHYPVPCAELRLYANGTYDYRSSLPGDVAGWSLTGIWKLEHTNENTPAASDYGIGGYVPTFYQQAPGDSRERTSRALIGRSIGGRIHLLGTCQDSRGRSIQFELTQRPG